MLLSGYFLFSSIFFKKILRSIFFISFLSLFFLKSEVQGETKETSFGVAIGKTLALHAGSFAVLLTFNLHDNDPSHKNFENAFKDRPRQDDDSDFFNFVLHPAMGSEYYLRARETGTGMWGSFLYSFCASIFWEYFIESWTEHPSEQDLVVTPILGTILGEIRYIIKNLSNSPHWLIDPIDTIFFSNLHLDIIRDGKKIRPMLVFNYDY